MSLRRFHACGAAMAALLLITSPAPASALSHLVEESDTLFGLSLRYDVPQSWIRRANGLEGDGIQAGRSLEIPVDGLASLEVRPGDTLSALSMELDVAVDELKRFNGLKSDSLRIGQVLTVPPRTPEGIYTVLPGDTLSDIARRFDVSVDRIRMYNSLKNDVIRPGEEIFVSAPRPEGHEVSPGESLWTIASHYGLDIDDLRDWNGIGGDVIRPGELICLYPGLEPGDNAAFPFKTEESVSLAAYSLPAAAPEQTETPALPEYGEYFFSAPDADRQPSIDYWEGADASSLTDYRRALKVLDAFDTEIESEAPLGRELRGWHIVIDPGHGGLDPGAIVSVTDGNGESVVVTEDEYAYDISLRIYRALVRHGASVSLTIISPDHHIREGVDARQTFVHRKNEVYASESHNGNAAWRPVGTADGLDMRKTIAADQIASVERLAGRRGTLFISVHADNSPDLPAGRAVLFDGADDDEKAASRELAATLASGLGGGSFIKEQPLRVLRDNPADAAVLVETRNVHYDRNAWALRSTELREQDAQMIVDGILAWAAQ